MNKRIITISRECGSGGHTIGKLLAEKLDISFYDKKLLELVSQKSGLTEDIIAEQGEHIKSNLLYNLATNISYAYNVDTKGSMILPDQIFAFQTEIIRGLAEKESCVIVGRCSDYILRNRDDCLHVFIHADMESKKARIISEHRVAPDLAEAHIKDREKKRSAHYHYYTDQMWGNTKNYSICLDSGALGIEKCVDLIFSALE
jgi:cytidylate kinase